MSTSDLPLSLSQLLAQLDTSSPSPADELRALLGSGDPALIRQALAQTPTQEQRALLDAQLLWSALCHSFCTDAAQELATLLAHSPAHASLLSCEQHNLAQHLSCATGEALRWCKHQLQHKSLDALVRHLHIPRGSQLYRCVLLMSTQLPPPPI